MLYRPREQSALYDPSMFAYLGAHWFPARDKSVYNPYYVLEPETGAPDQGSMRLESCVPRLPPIFQRNKSLCVVENTGILFASSSLTYTFPWLGFRLHPMQPCSTCTSTAPLRFGPIFRTMLNLQLSEARPSTTGLFVAIVFRLLGRGGSANAGVVRFRSWRYVYTP